jgi:hypothetical protein
MKTLLVAAFTICTCAFAYAQQVEPQAEVQSLQNTVDTTVSPIPEPLFILSEGGIKKELSTDDLGKLNITQIASVEMVLDSESLKEYGDKGRNGVMIISLVEN